MLAESPAPTGLKAYLLSAWSIVCLILYHLAIIFPRRLRPANDRPIHELHPTAYLDALRGYAAWIVYNFHIIRWEWQPQTFPARLFFKGVAMVDVFFVISGFALSYSIIGAIHRAAVETKTNNKKNYNKVLENLAGSVFRRYIRLYLPVTFASFVGFLVAATGIGIPPPGNGPQKLAPTFLENFRWWALDTLRCSDPFAHVTGWISGGLWPKWLEQFWTIPVEYRGSECYYF
jgi:peptidoglycan/LPS O-acetylase OafA/YrhL